MEPKDHQENFGQGRVIVYQARRFDLGREPEFKKLVQLLRNRSIEPDRVKNYLTKGEKNE